ncbi:MAG: transcriptional regulator [Armatimonadetes bacterium]|nr:transcriptional regulator [Armatimonadota bacterium]
MAEREYLVLSAIGPDRPGLVAALTAAVAAAGGNVEDSRMALLGGSFGIMMLLSGEPAEVAAMQAAAAGWEASTSLRIHLEATSAPQAGEARRYHLEVEAADREGIVHALAEALYELGGNIVNLSSALYPAPVSGAPLFRLELAVDVPHSVERQRLEGRLDALAEAENLDCRVVA